MSIDEFKQELVMILYSYLRFHHKQTEFVIAIPGHNEPPTKVMLLLKEKMVIWTVEERARSVNPTPSNLKHSELITDLLKIILFEKQGYALHTTLDLYLNKFPKWLALSSRLPLRNHLYEALKKFPKDKLQQSDEQSKNLIIKELYEKNSELSSELERVNAENKLLTEENQRYSQQLATFEQMSIDNSNLQHLTDVAINEYRAVLAQLEKTKEYCKNFQQTSVSHALEIEVLQTELQDLKSQIKPEQTAVELLKNESVHAQHVTSQPSLVGVEPNKNRDILTRSRSYNALPVANRWGNWFGFYKKGKPDSLRTSKHKPENTP